MECPMREEVIARNVAKLIKVTTPKYKVNRGLTTRPTALRLAETSPG